MTELYFVEKFCSWSRSKNSPLVTITYMHAVVAGEPVSCPPPGPSCMGTHMAEGKAESTETRHLGNEGEFWRRVVGQICSGPQNTVLFM